jgi:hypothetical protein
MNKFLIATSVFLLCGVSGQAADQPNMLDTFSFILMRHEVGEQPISYDAHRTEKVIEHTENRIVTETTQSDHLDRATLEVIDKVSCWFQETHEISQYGKVSTRYYLNSILPGHSSSGNTSGNPAPWLTLVFLANPPLAARCEVNYRGIII